MTKIQQTSERGLNLLGIIFLGIAITASINTAFIEGVSATLWLCYIGLFIIGIGIILRKDYLILSQLYILTIPLTVWAFDFLFHLITGQPLFGITDYFFTDGNILGKIISLQHIFTIPFALYALFRIERTNVAAWKISVVQLVLFFLLSRGISSPEKNINYVYHFAQYLGLGTVYPFYWFIAFFIMVGLTHFIFTHIYLVNFEKISLYSVAILGKIIKLGG